MSANLATKIELGLEELSTVREQLNPFIGRPVDFNMSTIETAAVCAMLHSFYTEIEKILKLIALDFDRTMPSAESWHRDLLKQMATATDRRPAVMTGDLIEALGEFLAFRHLFRGASIVMMRWNKLAPLVAKVDETHLRTRAEVQAFVEFISDRAT